MLDKEKKGYLESDELKNYLTQEGRNTNVFAMHDKEMCADSILFLFCLLLLKQHILWLHLLIVKTVLCLSKHQVSLSLRRRWMRCWRGWLTRKTTVSITKTYSASWLLIVTNYFSNRTFDFFFQQYFAMILFSYCIKWYIEPIDCIQIIISN